MARTINSLLRKGRETKRRRLRRVQLKNNPFVSGTCLKVTTRTPCKPNSALRKVAYMRLSTGYNVIAYLPGERSAFQEHNRGLVRGGAPKDLRGVNYTVVRGAYDFLGVSGRHTSRSKYGVKKNAK